MFILSKNKMILDTNGEYILENEVFIHKKTAGSWWNASLNSRKFQKFHFNTLFGRFEKKNFWHFFITTKIFLNYCTRWSPKKSQTLAVLVEISKNKNLFRFQLMFDNTEQAVVALFPPRKKFLLKITHNSGCH